MSNPTRELHGHNATLKSHKDLTQSDIELISDNIVQLKFFFKGELSIPCLSLNVPETVGQLFQATENNLAEPLLASSATAVCQSYGPGCMSGLTVQTLTAHLPFDLSLISHPRV